MNDEPLPRQRVAVTVFADVEAVDAHDGAYIVERALSSLGVHPTAAIPFTVAGEERSVRIHCVMDAGMAVGNGYMWLEPTFKAFPRSEEED